MASKPTGSGAFRPPISPAPSTGSAAASALRHAIHATRIHNARQSIRRRNAVEITAMAQRLRGSHFTDAVAEQALKEHHRERLSTRDRRECKSSRRVGHGRVRGALTGVSIAFHGDREVLTSEGRALGVTDRSDDLGRQQMRRTVGSGARTVAGSRRHRHARTRSAPKAASNSAWNSVQKTRARWDHEILGSATWNCTPASVVGFPQKRSVPAKKHRHPGSLVKGVPVSSRKPCLLATATATVSGSSPTDAGAGVTVDRTRLHGIAG